MPARLIVLALMAGLVACNEAPERSRDEPALPANQASAAKIADANCKFPKLDFSDAKELAPEDRERFTANLRAAIERACSDGLFAERPLVDPRAEDKETLVVMSSSKPVTPLIYFGPSAAPPAMLASIWFGKPVTQPTVDELHEAIYCEMRGATRDEQVRDARCEID